MRIHSRMEKAATTQADKTALLRLKDLNLKGQFKKGVHSIVGEPLEQNVQKKGSSGPSHQ